MVDIFHTYVRRTSFARLTPLTKEFTGITQQQADTAPCFQEAAALFHSWLGTKPYYLCSWGPDDKHQMLRQGKQQRLDLSWFRNYNDIQLLFTRLNGGDHGQRWGLKRALSQLGINFLGRQHHALDDAFNTAKLFAMIFSRIQLEENHVSDEPLHVSKLVYSDDDGEDQVSPFDKLAGLFTAAQ
ncbi:exonuclease domain-containing protein [Paenibacillus sp. GCM10023250]|uniref:exonuclease domain-containing protein n=1 Tax=Paenibacillus sp. GCM10023250 TaxID=3252648 RepID=UPI00360AC55F